MTESEVFGRFDTWAAGYLAQPDPAVRSTALAEGVAAATARRAMLRDLIISDPERALRHAVPFGVRNGLPLAVLPLLEDRVDGIGTFHAIAALAGVVDSPGFQASRRHVEIGGTRYETFAYGRRLELGSRSRLAIHGIAVDGRLALLDSPVRALEPGEPVPAGRRVEEVCAVSGEATTPSSPVAADTGDRVIYLCSAGHVSVLAAHLQAGEAGTAHASGEGESGGDVSADDAAPSVQGVRRVVMIRIRFADQPSWFQPESDASAAAMMAAADAFYLENSFGRLRIDGTVSPVYTLPETAAWYTTNDSSGYALNILNAARAVAADPASSPGNDGLPPTHYLEYDFEAVRYTTGPGTFSGQGYVAMRGCWIKSPDAGVLVHELGHNLGLWHANAWSPQDPLAPLGAGSNIEYGDAFDTMGPSRGGSWHFNVWEKRRLGWFDSGDVASVTPGRSTITLAAHDFAESGATVGPRAIRIPRDDDRDYWVEFRQHSGWLATRPGVHEGVTLRWDPWARSNGGTQLIDATPASAGDREDATLALGRTFSDPAAGIHITPVAVNATAPGSIDVEIQVGDFATNRPPLVSASAAVTSAAPGQPVQFTAIASDPDGDPLSFTWSFDDSGSTVSGPVVSHAWSTEGDQRARITVSDRRGGIASASLLIRVGAPAGSRISGRVIDLAGSPIPGALIHNGTEPGADAYRSAWSDADGTFTLLDVPPGTWELDASAPGWIFATDGFSHPVSTPQDTGEVTLLGCWRGFSISGLVRRADGTPVVGAIVRTGTRAEPTGPQGEFVLTGLAPGRHALTVEAIGVAFDPTTIELGLADIDTCYLTERTYTVSGTVASSTPVSVALTTGWQSTTAWVGSENAETSAPFSLSGVSAGTWTFRAVSPAASFSSVGSSPTISVDGDIAGVALGRDQTQSFAVAGMVHDRGFGVAGALVAVANASTFTDSRGAYWLPGLANGRYEVTVSATHLTFSPFVQVVDIEGADLHGIDFATDRSNIAPTFTEPPRTVGSVQQPFIRLSVLGADDDGPALLRYWWSLATPGPGDVTFASNGANAARETVARFSAPGDYWIRVTAVDRHGAAQDEDFLVSVRGDSAPPQLTGPARADPAVVGSTLETRLSVRASSDIVDPRLTYTWSVDPGAPGPVDFSTNGSAASADTVARFRAPGQYLLRVVVRDRTGRAIESSVTVRVELTYASWLDAHFTPSIVADTSLRASVWGELADPDGDSIVNLLEYAFSGDPMSASPDTRPKVHFISENGIEYLAITFRPNPDAIDLLFEPQVSSDMDSWQSGAVFVPGPDERVLTYRDVSPASAHQRRFIRVSVSVAAPPPGD